MEKTNTKTIACLSHCTRLIKLKIPHLKKKNHHIPFYFILLECDLALLLFMKNIL